MDLSTIPIYIINLPDRKDRWKSVLKSVYESGLSLRNAYRYNAVNGYTLSPNEMSQIVSTDALSRLVSNFEYRTRHDEITLGAIGCYLSHINIWKMLLDSNHTHCMVLEDDCHLDTNSAKVIQEALDTVKNNFDFLWLGTVISPNRSSLPVNNATQSQHSIVKLHTVYGTHAYIVSKEAVRRLLSKAFPLQYQIDSFISYNSQNLALQMYEIVPNVAWQSLGTASDIQNSCRGCGDLSQVYEVNGKKIEIKYSDKYTSGIINIVCVIAIIGVMIVMFKRRNKI